ncbi:NCS1 nucleoside transporter [Microdochium trichocladiopsis]|uniref:NCS1 nucleoside transporter n=1 Tax=Microdochium trichocladiopsis TaxID=1682393 RepID=A0A9P8XVZ6_9PEZI|nr:NCS1 nucleoside transporter [Microdochium trichocladiopsis]KAH7021200.1 NCS1 nucleoside transporter [Microdochium trichocladiopsis]
MDFSALRQRGQAAKEKAHERITNPSSWKLPKQASSIAPANVWSNADQDPVPVEQRTWTKWTFMTYWFSDLFTISTWQAGSAILTTGLSATDAVLIVFVAAMCNAGPTVLNGAIGSDLHIPFPIAARASFGVWFSYFCVVSRGILALFWLGVHSANGGACITVILTALWPSYKNLPNTLPASAGITSQGLLSYFIYWCIQFPLLLIPTHKLQPLFWFKTVLVGPAALATVIWIAVQAGGGGVFFSAPATVSGSTRAWLWLANLTSVTGGYSTLCVNIPDFSRFSKDRGAQYWQLPIIPILKTLCSTFGIIAASASQQLYGKTLWSPLEIISQWPATPGGRAAAFFAASCWLVGQVCVNISANGISFANDITSLAPKWFNIRRGIIFASLLGGWALCPWIIVSSAKAFLNFMSAYAIFMAPLAGIILCDYWIVKKRKYDVPALYDPEGIYKFNKWGTNWRAFVTTFLVIVPLLPALGKKVNPTGVSISVGLENLFNFNWLYGFFVALVLYWVLNVVWPHKPTLIPKTIYGDENVILDSSEADVESRAGQSEKGQSASSAASVTKEVPI